MLCEYSWKMKKVFFFSGRTTKVLPPYTNGIVVHATFFCFLSYYSLKRILTFFFSTIFGLKNVEKKSVFLLSGRGGYPPYTFSGPTTKKNTF